MSDKILLHTCCAPCFAGTHDQIKVDRDLSLFWFNPNIEPAEEHDKRLETLLLYIKESPVSPSISYKYDYRSENRNWNDFVRGFENEPEGGKRCERCFLYRMKRTAEMAKSMKRSFATTLTVSPYKNSEVINAICESQSNIFGTSYLAKDFKKNGGYNRSIDLSKKFGLYRQKYCGCRFSLNG